MTREEILQAAYNSGFEKLGSSTSKVAFSIRDLLDRFTRKLPKDVDFGEYADNSDRAKSKLLNAVTALRAGDTNVPTNSTTLARHAVGSIDSGELKALGFKPSYVAVPEQGQSQLRTYRHPLNNIHLHRHGDQYNVHEDAWPSLGMALARHKKTNPGASSLDVIKQLPALGADSAKHIALEGVPGYLNYIRGGVLGEGAFALPGRESARSGSSVQLLRGLAGSAAVGLAAGAATKDTGIGESAAAATAGALAGSKGAVALHALLARKGYLDNAPTAVSAALQLAGPALGAYAGWKLTKNRRDATRKDRRDQDADQLKEAYARGFEKGAPQYARIDAKLLEHINRSQRL